MPLFTLSNVNFKNIVRYPDIDFKPHIATFICGKSGSGKSTLLKLLNASISPDSGEIFFQGKSIETYDTLILRRMVCLVSQNVFLFQETIQNNFIEFYRYRELPPPEDKVIKEYLQLCLTTLPLDTNCRDMSGGERQRVFIAVCLSFMPKVLMLDEPTSALDEHTSHVLMDNLKNYCKHHHITLIVITHNRILTEKYADEVIYLDSEVEGE